jgi:hypothetical protein
MDEMHSIGDVLTLIVIFNLALAHHLKAISFSTSNKNSASNSDMKSVLDQALQLYGFAYQLQDDIKYDNDNNQNNETNTSCDDIVSHLRFAMIVSNNIGEIHRIAGDTKKHQMCLQHLLSAIMYMVDSNLITSNSSSYTPTLTEMMMDGFYYNVSPIILKDIDCAQAA